MKKWIRNAFIGLGIAVPFGMYTTKEYKDWKTPDMISTEVLANGSVMSIFRSKSNFIFDNIESLLGNDKNPRTFEENRFRYSHIDVLPIEQKAKKIVNEWARYEKNARDNKSNSWNATDQVVYNFLKNSGDLYRNYINEKLKVAKEHELTHLNSKRFLDADNSELEAYLNSLTISPLAMEDLIWTYTDKEGAKKKDANYEAAEVIIKEFLKYSDTPDISSLCHLKDFNSEMPKRAKEIRKKLKID